MNQILKETINEKLERRDKNGNLFLILKLSNGQDVLVFSSKVKEERWSWLAEGKKIKFTVEDGRNESKVLVDFEIETGTDGK
jgi:cold shock CspA family protein